MWVLPMACQGCSSTLRLPHCPPEQQRHNNEQVQVEWHVMAGCPAHKNHDGQHTKGDLGDMQPSTAQAENSMDALFKEQA